MSEKPLTMPIWKRWWVWTFAIIVIGVLTLGTQLERLLGTSVHPKTEWTVNSQVQPTEDELKNELKTYLSDHYAGKTSWYDSMKDFELVNVNGRYIIAFHTDLGNTNEDQQKAEQMLAGVTNWGKEKNRGANISSINILDKKGAILIHINGPVQ